MGKYIKHYDVKAPDSFVTRKKVEAWLESHFKILNEESNVLPEATALFYVLGFLGDVGLMNHSLVINLRGQVEDVVLEREEKSE